MSVIASVETYICVTQYFKLKVIAESIGFFSASASIVDFSSMMGHGMRIHISHRVTDQMRTQILHRFRL